MELSNEKINSLIEKEIEGSITAEEKQLINSWKSESQENQRYYQDLINVHSLSSKLFEGNVDTDKAWAKVKDQIQEKKVKSSDNRRLFRRNYWKYAAALVFVLTSVLLFEWNIKKSTPGLIEIIQPEEHVLFDGSKVLLAQNSALSQVRPDERSFILSGAGNFEVTHDDDNPFELMIDEVRVRDLGTVFEVQAYPMNDTVFVKVAEGIVQFYTLSNLGVILSEGEEGIFIKSLNQFYKRSIDQSKAYLSQSFKTTTLKDVLDHISYSFRKEVIVEHIEVLNCQISVEFEKAPFSIVKEIIEETLGLKISETDDQLIINGSGCN